MSIFLRILETYRQKIWFKVDFRNSQKLIFFNLHTVGLKNFKRCKIYNSNCSCKFQIMNALDQHKPFLRNKFSKIFHYLFTLTFLRLQDGVSDILKFFGYKLITRKLLKHKLIHMSIPTAQRVNIKKRSKSDDESKKSFANFANDSEIKSRLSKAKRSELSLDLISI